MIALRNEVNGALADAARLGLTPFLLRVRCYPGDIIPSGRAVWRQSGGVSVPIEPTSGPSHLLCEGAPPFASTMGVMIWRYEIDGAWVEWE